MRIEWTENLPEQLHAPGKYDALFAALARHKGKWAVFQRKFRGSTSSWDKLRPDYEFRVRSQDDGTRTCYARYVGGTRGKRGKKAKK